MLLSTRRRYELQAVEVGVAEGKAQAHRLDAAGLPAALARTGLAWRADSAAKGRSLHHRSRDAGSCLLTGFGIAGREPPTVGVCPLKFRERLFGLLEARFVLSYAVVEEALGHVRALTVRAERILDQ